VLTSSSRAEDIHDAYLHGANAYLVKPGNPKELPPMVKAIKDFWLTHNRQDTLN
jgi:CheY-like chemotaxis protein